MINFSNSLISCLNSAADSISEEVALALKSHAQIARIAKNRKIAEDTLTAISSGCSYSEARKMFDTIPFAITDITLSTISNSTLDKILGMTGGVTSIPMTDNEWISRDESEDGSPLDRSIHGFKNVYPEVYLNCLKVRDDLSDLQSAYVSMNEKIKVIKRLLNSGKEFDSLYRELAADAMDFASFRKAASQGSVDLASYLS
jgi:hypothetical protein